MDKPKTVKPKTVKPKTKSKTKAKTKAAAGPAKQVTSPAGIATASKPKAPAAEPEALNFANALTKKDIIEKVVQRSGIKKKDAKPVIEAMLAELGEALARGDTLNIRPFGKIRVSRRIAKPKAEILVCKLRQPRETPTPDNPLADQAD
ncbi:MAG: HU family DNA-binding protein [Halocynthiibacter sp.]